MKRTLTIAIFISLFTAVSLQAQGLVSKRGAHQHEGFFMSLGVGPVFGEIKEKGVGYAGNDVLIYGGTGALLDFKIGGLVSENLILHATLTSAAIVGPTMELESSGEKETASSDFSIGEVMYGAGATYYFMPANMFLSASVGFGRYVASRDSYSNTSDFGIGIQLKVGKEWWVGDNWGIGVGASYSTTSADAESSKLGSNRFSVMANVTFD